ncbi:MAG: type II toxin-antitoxin system CcdA family antitoxin [Candidatus Bathyarchaeia archaeon]|jgi:predicted lipase
MSEIITVRVDKALKEKIRQYKINVSETVRLALEDQVSRIENAELTDAINQMKLVLNKIPEAEIVTTIHHSRDQR